MARQGARNERIAMTPLSQLARSRAVTSGERVKQALFARGWGKRKTNAGGRLPTCSLPPASRRSVKHQTLPATFASEPVPRVRRQKGKRPTAPPSTFVAASVGVLVEHQNTSEEFQRRDNHAGNEIPPTRSRNRRSTLNPDVESARILKHEIMLGEQRTRARRQTLQPVQAMSAATPRQCELIVERTRNPKRRQTQQPPVSTPPRQKSVANKPESARSEADKRQLAAMKIQARIRGNQVRRAKPEIVLGEDARSARKQTLNADMSAPSATRSRSTKKQEITLGEEIKQAQGQILDVGISWSSSVTTQTEVDRRELAAIKIQARLRGNRVRLAESKPPGRDESRRNTRKQVIVLGE